MSPVKQEIRTVQRAGIGDFDEQLWPVNVVLLVMAGCIAALIVTTGDFSTHRLLANGWVQLWLLAIVALVLVWGATRLHGHAQRRLQLGVFLSLLAHLWLLFVAHHLYLRLIAEEESDSYEFVQQDEPVMLPDYHSQPADQPQPERSLERPAETPVPEIEQPEIERIKPEPTPVEKQPTVEPQTAQLQPPLPIQVERTEVSAPHRSQELAGVKLSRQEFRDRRPLEQVSAPQLPQPSLANRQPDARLLEVQRQQLASQPQRRPTPEQSPDMSPDRRRAQLQRRRSQQQTVADTAVRRPERQIAQANTGNISATVPAAEIAIAEVSNRQVAEPIRPSSRAATTRASGEMTVRELKSSASQVLDSAPSGVVSKRPPSRVSVTDGPSVSRVEPGRLLARASTAGDLLASLPSDTVDSSAPVEGASQPVDAQADVKAPEMAAQRVSESSPAVRPPRRLSQPAPAQTTSGALGAAALGQPRRTDAEFAAVFAVAGRTGGVSPAISSRKLAGVPGDSIDVARIRAPGPTERAESGSQGSIGPTPDLGAEPARPAATLPTSATGRLTAATAANEADSGMLASLSANGAGPRRVENAAADAPALLAGVGGSPLVKRSTTGLPAELARLDTPGIGVTATPRVTSDDIGSSSIVQPTPVAESAASKRETGSLPVRITALPGPGGLSSNPAPDVGLPSRRARPESEVVHPVISRLLLQKSGGELAIDARVRDTAVPGLKQRDAAGRGEIARSRGGTAGTERAVEMGLDFLARHQFPDGRWSLHNFGAGRPEYAGAGLAQMHSDTAATGLALLAFLGAGYTHTDGKYRSVVASGLGYLLERQKSDGDLFVPEDAVSNRNVWLYSHGIAAIALCEAYGMTGDSDLRQPAQRALDFIGASQDPQRGGWRYSPQQGSDTSVSGWQLMALKSGELAGLVVPRQSYRRVQRWLDHAQGTGGNPSRYAYRPLSTQRHQRQPSRVMTAEALLMRQYLGWKRSNPNLVRGADYLKTQLPQFGTQGSRGRDAYYWYYATQVMFQMQGDHWQQWNEQLRSLLTNSQEQSGVLAGSWDPLRPTPDRWGTHAGRIYVTALHLLMLEVYYRHLPLYQNLEE